MQNILIPVDGSESCSHAVQHVIDLHKRGAPLSVHLLNVQPPIISGDIRRFVTQAIIDNYHQSEGEAALSAAKTLLNRGGLTYKATIRVGHIAESIAAYAREERSSMIVMGTRGMGPLKNLVLGSVAMQVIHLADVPVTLVK